MRSSHALPPAVGVGVGVGVGVDINAGVTVNVGSLFGSGFVMAIADWLAEFVGQDVAELPDQEIAALTKECLRLVAANFWQLVARGIGEIAVVAPGVRLLGALVDAVTNKLLTVAQKLQQMQCAIRRLEPLI